MSMPSFGIAALTSSIVGKLVLLDGERAGDAAREALGVPAGEFLSLILGAPERPLREVSVSLPEPAPFFDASANSIVSIVL